MSLDEDYLVSVPAAIAKIAELEIQLSRGVAHARERVSLVADVKRLEVALAGYRAKIERLRDLSCCPPDDDLEHWIGVLVGAHDKECEEQTE